MSDSLRDRIANTLYQELSIELPAAIRGADAVIEALGLKLESGRNVVWSAHGLTDKATRYVTEWKTDE